MNLQPALVFALLLVVSGLLFLVAYLYHLYLSEKHKRVVRSAPLTPTAATSVVTHAQERAGSIVQKAVEKAEHTLLDTEYIRSDLVKGAEERLNTVVSKIVASLEKDGAAYEEQYKTLFENMNTTYAAKVEESIQRVENTAVQKLADLTKSWETRMSEAEGILEKQIQQELAGSKQAISEYQAGQLKKIDERVEKVLASVIREVAGKSIPLESHEKLLFEALEEAKREHVFYTLDIENDSKSEYQSTKSETNSNDKNYKS